MAAKCQKRFGIHTTQKECYNYNLDIHTFLDDLAAAINLIQLSKTSSASETVWNEFHAYTIER